MLDRLPAWGRHLVIAFAATFLGSLANAVIVAGGATGVSWPDAAVAALNLASTSTASIALALYLTPLTRQYGVGSGDPLPEGVDE